MSLIQAVRPARNSEPKQASTLKAPFAPLPPAAGSPLPEQAPPTSPSLTHSLRRSRNFASRPPLFPTAKPQSLQTSDPSKIASEKNPSKWDGLSDSERAACVGDKYEEKCFKKYRWDIQGMLRDEIWDHEVHPELKKIVNNHFATIYSKGGIHEVCNFHLWFLSSQDDPTTAQPVIVVITNDKAAGKRTTKTILKSASFNKLNTGFDIKILVTKVQYPTIEALNAGSISPSKGLFDSLCGSRVFVSALPVTEESTWKQTTLGGVLVLDKQYYGVTVAHCFRADLTISTPEIDSFTDCSDESDQSMEAYSSTSDQKIAGKGKGSIAHEDNSPAPDLPPQGIYTGTINARRSDEAVSDDLSASSPDMLALVGYMFSQFDGSEDTSKIALFSDELDWALIRIQDTRFMQRNEAVISTDLQIQPSFINFNSELPRRKAFLVGGVSGPREVSISGTMSSIMFPWARTLQTVWTIEFPAAPGDSGAWVIGRDGRIYGMVVATAPLLKLTYILRAEDLFESIIGCWSGSITLGDIFPTNTLEELKVTPSLLSIEEEVILPLDWKPTARRNIPNLTGFEGRPASRGYASSLGPPSTTHDSGFVSQSPFAEITETEALLYDEAKLLQVERRLPSIAVAFMEIMPGDFEACKDFVKTNPDILGQDIRPLISEAMHAYRERRIVFTRACIERIVMIQDLGQEDSSDIVQHYFDPLIRHEQERLEAFSNRFNVVLTAVKMQGQKLREPVATGLATTSLRPGSEREQRLLDMERDTVREDGENYDPEFGARRRRPVPQPHNASSLAHRLAGIDPIVSDLRPRRDIATRPPEPDKHFSTIPLATSTKIAGSGRGTKEKLDTRYIVRPSRFFSLGRVFALLWHESTGTATSGSTSSADRPTAFGEEIYSTIRRMIVVKEGHGFSICIPIATYGGRGVLKSGLTIAEVTAHAIVYMKGNLPEPLPEELRRGMNLDPICIIPSSPDQKLHPASRINFGKLYSVEHNVKAMNIGTVDPGSIPRFLAYFRTNLDSGGDNSATAA